MKKLLLLLVLLLPTIGFNQTCTPTGDQTTYGNNSWIGYVYDDSTTGIQDFASSNYKGFITEADIFDSDYGGDAISGTNLCGTYSDHFSIRYKMTKDFPAGNYIFTVGGDDGYRLSIDGGATFLPEVDNFTAHGYVRSVSNVVFLSGNVDLVLEYFELNGGARVSFTYKPYILCTATGDQTTYGDDSWIGYVYDDSTTGIQDFAPSNYKGFVTEAAIFSNNYITNPISGTDLCDAYSEYFSVRYKMIKNFPAGYYTFTVGGDDTYRLSIDGGVTFLPEVSNSYSESVSNPIFLNGNVNLVLEYFQQIQNASLSFSYAETCVPNGDQITYGNDSWIGYVYDDHDMPEFDSSSYKGFVTEAAIFSSDYGYGAISGTDLCGTYSDGFSIRYKMRKNFPAGNYIFTVGGDNGYRLSIDGGATYLPEVNNFIADSGYNISESNAIFLSGDVDIVLDYYEQHSIAKISFSYKLFDDTATLANLYPFGNNVWNVYGFEATTFNPAPNTYKGSYVQTTLGVDTEEMWFGHLSPSSSAGWVGSPLSDDNFTYIEKRKGFPCGKYNLYLDRWDDAIRVLLNGNMIFYGASISYGTGVNLGDFMLNGDSTIEIINIEIDQVSVNRLTITPLNTVAVYDGSWTTAPDNLPVEIKSNLDITSNLSACSCTISNAATVTVKSTGILVVDDFVNVGNTSKLIVENNGSLVQNNNTAVNTGKITVKRTSTPMKKSDYTYWSSPVAGATLSNLSTPSPTVSYVFDPTINQWVFKSAGTVMETGRGYIARTPDALNYATPQTVEAVFNGIPNNGIYTVPLITGQGTSNLLGNPYPSAVDLDTFLLDPNNRELTTGTVYLWTHTIPIKKDSISNMYVYTANDYAKYNLTGGTKSISSSAGGTVPNGSLASGQGFFVESVGPVGTRNLVFNNNMRPKTVNKNNQFFRSSNAGKTNNATVIKKNRLWLSISNQAGAYDETLLGYITGATNGLDYGYDGKTFSGGNVVSLYSMLGDVKLAIQGRDLNFNENDVIPLGFSATTDGTYSIKLENLDGFFSDKSVFLVDKLNDIVTDLKFSKYTFNTAKGTFNNRFELRYISTKLSTGSHAIAENDDIIIFKKNNGIEIASRVEAINSVSVYDLLGRVIFQNKRINNTSFYTDDLGIKNQVVIVKVTLGNGAEVTRKVIMD